MSDLMTIARRHAGINSFSSLISSPVNEKPPSWGCHLSEVQRLLHEGDRLFLEVGLNGSDERVKRAADEVASALATMDINIVRHAVGEFMVIIRELTK